MYITHHTAAFGGSVGIKIATKGVYSELDLRINILYAELKKAITNIQKSPIRTKMIALGIDKAVLSNEYDVFTIPVVQPKGDTAGHGHGLGRGQTSSEQTRVVGKQASKLSEKYHLSDITKFVDESNGYRRPFTTAERKKRMLCLNRPYWPVLAKQLKTLPPEQVRAKNEQLKKLYAERQAKRVASNRARRAEDEQEASEKELANQEANRCISAATRQLEAAKLDTCERASSARSDTQLDEANQVNRLVKFQQPAGQQRVM